MGLGCAGWDGLGLGLGFSVWGGFGVVSGVVKGWLKGGYRVRIKV